MKSGVPHESVLAPIMLLVFVNDMTEGVSSYTNLFANYSKLLRTFVGNTNLYTLLTNLLCNTM